jgi:hypothetical protein
MKKLLCALVASATMLSQIGFADAAPRRSAKRVAPAPVAQPVLADRYGDVYIGPINVGDGRIFWSSVVVGGAATGAYFAVRHKRALKAIGDSRSFSTGGFALTTVGCMALAPMLAAFIVWNTERRYLTSQEAIGLNAGCIIPFIGPLIVDAAYRAHPEWPR